MEEKDGGEGWRRRMEEEEEEEHDQKNIFRGLYAVVPIP
jgi:hypothetical protein